MLAKVLLAGSLLVFIHSVSGGYITRGDDINETIHSRRNVRVLLPNNAQRTRPVGSGIHAFGDLIAGGIRDQVNIFSGGVRNVTDQFKQLSHNLTHQTATIIDKSKQFVSHTIQQVSLPGLTAATLLLIGNFNAFSRATGKDTIKLPPVDTNLLGFASFKTSEGRLTRLSSLRMNGRLQVIPALTNMTLLVPLTFDELSATYNAYAISTWMMNLNGNVTVKVGGNDFLARIVLSGLSTCTVNIQRVEVTSLKDLDVQITGLCGWCSAIASGVANFLQGMIQVEVQKAVDDGLRQLLKKNHLLFCSRPR